MSRIKKILAAVCSFSIIFSYTQVTANATQSFTASYNTMYVLTGDGATDIVNIALAQAGKKKADFGYSESWCGDFVSDCAILAGVQSAIPQNGQVSSLYKAVIAAGGAEVTLPQKGDLVFYYCSIDGYVHVGIMVDSLKSIEGNYSGKVSLVNGIYRDSAGHSLAAGTVIRKFVRPAYNGAVIAPPAQVQDPVPTQPQQPTPEQAPAANTTDNTKKNTQASDKGDNAASEDSKDISDDDKKDASEEKKQEKFSKKYAGTYKVTTESTSLTLRKKASTESEKLASIPKDTKVKVTKANGTSDESWAYLTYKGKKGYVSMEFLKKVKK